LVFVFWRKLSILFSFFFCSFFILFVIMFFFFCSLSVCVYVCVYCLLSASLSFSFSFLFDYTNSTKVYWMFLPTASSEKEKERKKNNRLYRLWIMGLDRKERKNNNMVACCVLHNVRFLCKNLGENYLYKSVKIDIYIFYFRFIYNSPL